MKNHIDHKVNLLIGVLSLNALSACLNTKPTLGIDQKYSPPEATSTTLLTSIPKEVLVLDSNTLKNLKLHNFSKKSIKEHLDQGLSINAKDDSTGLTLLMHTIIARNGSATRFLINRKADLNIQNTYGDSPLSTKGDTALHIATRNDFVTGISFLLQPNNNIDVNIQNSHQDTALILAAHYKHLYAVHCLLKKGKKHGIKAELKNRDGNTFLTLGEKNNIPTKPEWWWFNDSEEEVQNPKILDTQNLEKLKADNFSIQSIKEYLSQGKSINAQDVIGLSLLMHTIIAKNPSATQFVIEQKPDLNIQNSYGDSPLSTKGDTALHIAARIRFVAGVDLLLQPNNKIDVNIQNSHQDTALILAAHYIYPDVIESLLRKGKSYGIKAELKNRDGNTFLTLVGKNKIAIKDEWW